MTEAPLSVRAETLERFTRAVLECWGTPAAVAARTAELMVRTDLRGVDSHGVGMLAKYHEWYRAGYIVPGAEPKVVRDEGPTASVDGNQGFGHHVSTIAMELAIAKARARGTGFVAVFNSNHCGAAANYSMMALAHDMIGLSMTNSPWPATVPTFGRQPMLGTNPLSVAAPAGREYPFVLDMATSTVAIGKLHVASRWARPIPAGWALAAPVAQGIAEGRGRRPDLGRRGAGVGVRAAPAAGRHPARPGAHPPAPRTWRRRPASRSVWARDHAPAVRLHRRPLRRPHAPLR